MGVSRNLKLYNDPYRHTRQLRNVQTYPPGLSREKKTEVETGKTAEAEGQSVILGGDRRQSWPKQIFFFFSGSFGRAMRAYTVTSLLKNKIWILSSYEARTRFNVPAATPGNVGFGGTGGTTQ